MLTFNVKDQWLLKYCTESGPPGVFTCTS